MTDMNEKFSRSVAAYLKNARYTGKSKKTLANYEKRLRLYGLFCADNDLREDDFRTVSAWRDSMLDAGMKPSSVSQYLNELKIFFTAVSNPIFGSDLCYPKNPVSPEFFPKVAKRPYDQILTDEQAAKLIPNQKTTAAKAGTWPRNYAICALLLTSKIRNSELLDLTLSDLDFRNGELTVSHGKGDKFRVTEFSPFAQSAVRLYLLSGIRPGNLPDSAPLFGTTAAHTFGAEAAAGGTENFHAGTAQWLSSLVERHVYAATGVRNVRTHDLRHVGSRLALNAGASMELLQSELGHSSMNTTQIYSGRLTMRRGQNAAAAVFSLMNEWAERNQKTADALERAAGANQKFA